MAGLLTEINLAHCRAFVAKAGKQRSETSWTNWPDIHSTVQFVVQRERVNLISEISHGRSRVVDIAISCPALPPAPGDVQCTQPCRIPLESLNAA